MFHKSLETTESGDNCALLLRGVQRTKSKEDK